MTLEDFMPGRFLCWLAGAIGGWMGCFLSFKWGFLP